MAWYILYSFAITTILLSVIQARGLAYYENDSASSPGVQSRRFSSTQASTFRLQGELQGEIELTSFDRDTVDNRHRIRPRHLVLPRMAVSDPSLNGKRAYRRVLGRSASASAEPVAQPFAFPNAFAEASAGPNAMPLMYSLIVTHEALTNYAVFIGANEKRTERLLKAVNEDEYLKGVVTKYFETEIHEHPTLQHFHDFIRHIPENSALRTRAINAASVDTRLHASIVKLMNHGWA